MQTAECRGCGMKLIGKPYHMGGIARHPETNEQCKVSFWGGFVCSESCDSAADKRQRRSIDLHAVTGTPDIVTDGLGGEKL